jgi:hypothetical protein
MENGLGRLTSRDVSENSNARVVRTALGSGFVAVIGRQRKETFSPDFGSQPGDAAVDRPALV